MHIMIVDDDIGVATTAQALLEDAGHKVTVRSSALGTMAKVLNLRPQLLLLDIEMPSLNGIQLAGIVRRRAADTVVVLYSGRSADELEVLAVECGAQGYLCKDTSPRKLLEYIESFAT